MSAAVPVLDHGLIRLVRHMGDDCAIVDAARVSYGARHAGEGLSEADDRLIRRLWRDRHCSPFESVAFTFEIKAPIFVLRQWMRHRTWSWSELSGRYRELPVEFYILAAAEVGVQAAKNKQGRDAAPDTIADREREVEGYRMTCDAAFVRYRALLDAGWPRELARCVLPLSTYSHAFGTVNLRNLFGFFDLRCDPHAQAEILVYADAMRELVRPVVPVALSAWEASA